jgi:hypothetical protein
MSGEAVAERLNDVVARAWEWWLDYNKVSPKYFGLIKKYCA